jgi:uncharacterized membrane protein
VTRILTTRYSFAIVLIALGAVGLVTGELVPIWAPVPDDLPGRGALAYPCAIVSLGAGAGLVVRRFAAIASGILLGALGVWIAVFRVSPIIRAPDTVLSWYGLAETAAIAAAATVLCARLAWPDTRRGVRAVAIGRILYGLAMIPFGLAHFAFVDFTASLVPGWIPAHVAWVYVTGAAFLAAAVAILTGAWAPLAAELSALQIGVFTALVWVPVVVTGSADASAWSEFGISTALAAAGSVVAASYRDAHARSS